VGSLDARRDFLDVRDAGRALMAVALRGRPQRIYEAGTGQSHRVGEGLERLIALSGRSVILEHDPAAAGRAAGPAESRADCRPIFEDTSWGWSIPWEQSLADLWDEAIRRTPLPLTARPASV
jgi:nucleoside-diphosphate-sugar epimerase